MAPSVKVCGKVHRAVSVTIRETADQGDRRRAIIVASGRVTLRLPESELAALIAEGMLARIKRARREHEHDAECADDYELEHDRDLADRIAALLEAEGGLPALQIARKVRRRRADVIAVLHSDARFDRTGTGRGTRWTAGNTSGTRHRDDAGPEPDAPSHRQERAHGRRRTVSATSHDRNASRR